MLKDIFLAIALVLSSSFLLAQEIGEASFYSDNFHGRLTASGEKYNKNAFTAAHKLLAFGTIIKVTRIDNNKSIEVRINDRGPFIEGRIVDLSRVAAEKLGLTRDGITDVSITVLENGKPGRFYDANATQGPRVEVTKPVVTQKEKVTKPSDIKTSNPNSNTVLNSKGTSSTKKKVTTKPKPKVRKRVDQGLYKLNIETARFEGFGVQIGFYKNYTNAIIRAAELRDFGLTNIMIHVDKENQGKEIFKIIVGPYLSRDKAYNKRKEIRNQLKLDVFVVNLFELKPF